MAGSGKLGLADVQPTIDTLISDIVTENFTEYGKILPLVNNVSQFYRKGLKSILFPCVDEFTPEKGNIPLDAVGPLGGPDAISCEKLVATTEELNIDCVAMKAVQYDPCELEFSNLDWASLIAQKAANSLLRQIESDLIANAIANVDAANALTTAAPGLITEGDLICAVTALDLKNVPRADRVLLVNPAANGALMGLECLKQVNTSGSNSVLREAELGRLFGAPVIWDSRVPAEKAYYFHKDHVRYGQMGQVFRMQDQEAKKGCVNESWRIKYGHMVVKGGCRGVVLDLVNPPLGGKFSV